MKVAIITKYLGPTSTKGARIKAILSKTESMTLPMDHEKNGWAQRHDVAIALMAKVAPKWKPDYLGQAGHPTNPSEDILFFEV